MFIKPEEIEWKKVRYIKTPLETTDEDATWSYEFWLNEPLASWDVFSYWEKERIASMQKHLKKGDILFDIGTESGWCNLAYAEMVGPENMVLIEPTKEFWGNIYQLWKKNLEKDPKACYWGLLDAKTRDDADKGLNIWQEAKTMPLIDKNKYQYIHEHEQQTPSIELDVLVEKLKIVPDAITIDVEGAELLVFKGAKQTLKKHKPKLFVSIHPDLGERDYNVKKEDTIAYLESFGYKGEYLATDHEEHWYFV